MKKLSKIDESIWSDIQKRSSGDVIRKEDGTKIKNCLGVDLIVRNPKYDYDELIKDILDYNVVVIIDENAYDFTSDELSAIRDWEDPYTYLVSSGNIELYASYIKYLDLVNFEIITNPEDLLEEDYIAVCRCISTKLKEINDTHFEYFEFIPIENESIRHSTYVGQYHLVLVTSDYPPKRFEDFKESLVATFQELKNVDFIRWFDSKGKYNIGIPISYDGIMNIETYREFSQKIIDGCELQMNESIWADIQKRSSGKMRRKEDNVNNLSMEDFKKYLENHYEYTKDYITTTNPLVTTNMIHTSLSMIAFAIKKENSISYFHLDLTNKDENYRLKLFKRAKGTNIYDLLRKKYIMKEATDSWDYELFPKLRDVDKKFFIDVLDFIITNTQYPEESVIRKKHINESIWSDIQKISSGEKIKKEDDIDILDNVSFCEYLKEKYIQVSDDIRCGNYSPFYLPDAKYVVTDVFSYMNNWSSLHLNFYKNGDKDIDLTVKNFHKFNQVFQRLIVKLRENFSISTISFKNDANWYKIIFKPKDNSPVTNTFYINVLDFLIEESNKYTVKKMKNFRQIIFKK